MVAVFRRYVWRLCSILLQVYNRVDIEVHLEADETLTKVLYESNDVLMTEASLQWKRYPHISPVYVKVSSSSSSALLVSQLKQLIS